MAQHQSIGPAEQVLVEFRAVVFLYDSQVSRWNEVAESNVCSRVFLISTRPYGSMCCYRIFGRLESTGHVRFILKELKIKYIPCNFMLYDLVSPFGYTRENFISFLKFITVNETLFSTPSCYFPLFAISKHIQRQAGLNLFLCVLRCFCCIIIVRFIFGNTY
mgnify:CR=1 FL=1